MELTLGIIAEKKRQVTENDTALHLGSGSLPVLATPAVVAWIEHCATCVRLTITTTRNICWNRH